MAAPLLHLTFTDGREESIKLNPRVLVEIERKFGADVPGIEGTLYGAWHRLGRPGDFDDWLDSLESLTEEEASADPSQPGASDDT